MLYRQTNWADRRFGVRQARFFLLPRQLHFYQKPSHRSRPPPLMRTTQYCRPSPTTISTPNYRSMNHPGSFLANYSHSPQGRRDLNNSSSPPFGGEVELAKQARVRGQNNKLQNVKTTKPDVTKHVPPKLEGHALSWPLDVCVSKTAPQDRSSSCKTCNFLKEADEFPDTFE